jgi:ankyrin repeat protein/L-ascorbate metabolism protein UlaG (beta-lactamase superfamily)
MKCFKMFLFVLLLMLVLQAWSAEIHEAALNGDLAKVKELLAKDPALLNAKGHNEKAPIHWAAQGGHLELVKYLIAKGANINELNIQKETPLVYAAEGGHLKLAKLLIAKGASVNLKTTLDAAPINYALWAGRTEMVKLLLKKGSEFKLSRGEGFTLLHEAAGGESAEIVALLLKKGMATDLKTGFGATPLHYAVLNGRPETISLLIKKGADVNAVSQNGWWPLGLAAARGNLQKVAILLAAGAKPDIRDQDSGLTILHVAAAKGYGKICAMLIEKGADVNAKDPDGKTPLYYADRYQHRGISALLKEKGAAAAEKKGPADRPWLSEPLTAGNAVVWYLGHSGWAVKTQNHLLIFDYWKNDASPDEPALANGTINPLEVRDLNVTVFASHAHNDHYMPEIFAWRKAIPKITYIMGFKPDNAEGYIQLPNREKRELNDLEILPIESNDSGQGYFIRVDGVNIFHPGDHANRQRDFSGPFKKEIDFLADQGLKADILFLPVSGCGFGDIVSVKKGDYYTMDRLSARSVFPMHAAGNEIRYREFAKEAKNAGYEIPICAAEFPGDHFLITPEGVKWASVCVPECEKKDASGNCSNQ